MHVGFINMDNQKMSKSLGNIVLAKDAVDKFGGNAIRHLFYTTHYRAPINFTEEAIQTSVNEINKYQQFLNKLISKKVLNNLTFTEDIYEEDYNLFLDYLSSDLNIANGFTILDKIVKQGNILLRNNNANVEDLSKVYNTFKKMINVLGFDFKELEITDEDKEIYSIYLMAKQEKDYVTSDRYRNILIKKGIL